MLRAGRFRHRLLDDSFLKNQGPQAFYCLQPFLQKWSQKDLDDVEIAAIYILIFAFLRRPKDFLGGVHNKTMDDFSTDRFISGDEVIDILQSHLPESLRDAKSLNRLRCATSFVKHFCSLSWRSIPLSVSRSLMAWKSGRYPLRLLLTLPTPEEVLHMQAGGERCISMLIQKEQIVDFVEEGRDVLGFIVHDLIHADHFFADSEKARTQISFSQKLLQIQSFPQIRQMMTEDAVFEKEFHYLMSDMNSVPLHLLKTLKAVFLGFYKRRSGLPMQAPLSFACEKDFLHLYESALQSWEFSAEALQAAHRLNTPYYQGPDDGELLHQALSLT